MTRALGPTSAYAVAFVAGCLMALATGWLGATVFLDAGLSVGPMAVVGLLAMACGSAAFVLAWGRLRGAEAGGAATLAALALTLVTYGGVAGLIYAGIATPSEAQALFLFILFLLGRLLVAWRDG